MDPLLALKGDAPRAPGKANKSTISCWPVGSRLSSTHTHCLCTLAVPLPRAPARVHGYAKSKCTCVESECTCVESECTCVESECMCVESECTCVQSDCTCVESECTCHPPMA